ncbi:MAG: hypothetical protein GXP62_18560, partial [Oligoflexia bacterium]|nr:hypothetical protein [Oligoflexia bacterium]
MLSQARAVARFAALTPILLAPISCADGQTDSAAAAGPLITQTGAYELFVEMTPDPPVAGDTSLSVMVHDAQSGDMLMGCQLAVTPWMPEHDHGIADQPIVVEDQGVYTVTFAYSMPGAW